uniref:ENTH domain-containing protein n=1 Tax=Knipowitschia caucasica TaxID=637954 RepID=A0AAV2K8N7_KNICA
MPPPPNGIFDRSKWQWGNSPGLGQGPAVDTGAQREREGGGVFFFPSRSGSNSFYQLTGSDMARAVCKATTHEVSPPKKKHLEYLVSATNTTNVNIPQMADTLFERSTNASWVVVFKALSTTHHLCIHGNEVDKI